MEIITEDQLRALIVQAVKQHGSQKELAHKMGVSASYLSDIINYNRPISDTVAKFFGKRMVRAYVEEQENV